MTSVFLLKIYYILICLWKNIEYCCILYSEVICLKKLSCLFALTFATVGLYFTAVNAYADTIRVGLEKNFKSVSSITVSDESMGVGIGDGNKYKVSGTYTVKPVSGNYYHTERYYNTYEEAYSHLSDYTGYNCIVTLTDSGWSIYVRTDGKKLDLTSANTKAYCVGFAANGTYKFLVDGSNPARANGADGVINVGSNAYRDDIEFYRSGSTLTGINVIDGEKYLYGVINSEMPSSWSKEAQKAQAVAARTYMNQNKGKHNIYDICDNTHCQDYNGTKKETEAGIAAVNETKGLCAYYNDKLITAVYFSSDGGATLDGAQGWGNETPYLVGKKDIYEKECKEWTREFTYNELTNICSANGFNIGNVVSVSAEYDNNGLVIALTFKGSNGEKTVKNNNIRSVFSSSNGGSLLSRNFIVASGATTVTNGQSVYVVGSDGGAKEAMSSVSAQNGNGQKGALGKSYMVESTDGAKRIEAPTSVTTGKNGVVTLTGKGFGHNVGMSQYGAKGMAEAGYNFKDILNFYYTGIEIK